MSFSTNRKQLKIKLDLVYDQSITKNFMWITHDGRRLHAADMDTGHIAYSLRMIWNHLAPEGLRISGGKEWHGIDRWPIDYLRASVISFVYELTGRDDLTVEHKNIVKQILDRTKPGIFKL